MIIFDLDGTLADCEHRRHFVDVNQMEHKKKAFEQGDITWEDYKRAWKPDWKAFFEACDKDIPNIPVIKIFEKITKSIGWSHGPFIWSGRCESVREKTIEWLCKHLKGLPEYGERYFLNKILKMRPQGDKTPDEILKMIWLDEALERGETVDYVFDDRAKVVKAWRDRGVFVFDCNQTGKIF